MFNLSNATQVKYLGLQTIDLYRPIYLLKTFVVVLLIVVLPSVALAQNRAAQDSPWILPGKPTTSKSKTEKIKKVVKSDRQWRKQLSSEEYEVTRKKGTEIAYSGKYWDNKKDGVYICKCCQHTLFDSKQKYDSKTGWPSYTAPKSKLAVGYRSDRGHGMVRTEVICKRCDAHLGHVFEDGPQPTGLRYCMNSIALKFVDRSKWKKQSTEKSGEKNDAKGTGDPFERGDEKKPKNVKTGRIGKDDKN